MYEYHYTLNVQAQANTFEDLVRAMDEIKAQISSGSSVAHDANEVRRYALSIEEEKPFEHPEGWEFKDQDS